MTFIAKFKNASEADKSRAVQKLITDSTPDFDFFLLIVLSFLMATFGLLIDSTAVVIGSMLIAPILHPMLSVSLGLVMSDYKLISRSIQTLGKSTLLGVGAAGIATLLLQPLGVGITGEILSRAEPSLLYFAVAVVAGIAVSYTLVQGALSESLPGIAVSVALLPPLAVVGIGIAQFNWDIVAGAALLFALNAIGIIFASMVSFSLMNLYVKRAVAEDTIQKEDKRVEEETEKAEQIAEQEKSGTDDTADGSERA